MNEHEQAILDGLEATLLASDLDRSTLALVDALAAFTRLGADRLHTVVLIEAMEDEESWSEWSTVPVPAAARELAELLEDHGVRPRSVTVAGRRARGYRREDLEQAFQGYASQALLQDYDQDDMNPERN